MDAYRATVTWRSEQVPVIVVDTFVEPNSVNGDGSIEYGGPRLLCIRQDDGHHIEARPYEVTCVEPSYLLPKPAPEAVADHEHQFPLIATPVLENGRIVAMERTCTFTGCEERVSAPPKGGHS